MLLWVTGCRDDASRATDGLPSAADAPLQRSELAKSAITSHLFDHLVRVAERVIGKVAASSRRGLWHAQRAFTAGSDEIDDRAHQRLVTASCMHLIHARAQRASLGE